VNTVDKSTLPLDQSTSSESDINRPTAHLTITEYDSIFEVVDDCSGTKDLYRISHNAWVSVGHDIYILSIKGGSIKLEKGDDGQCKTFVLIFFGSKVVADVPHNYRFVVC
jgi:hypothetical protein